MLMSRRHVLQAAVVAPAGLILPRAAQSQAYPARPVRIVVATAAGGTTDILSRLIGQRLTERLGQSFVVENRPGGGNNIGTEVAVRAPADGYTLFMANTVNTINTTLYRSLSFDFPTDIEPIALLMRSPLILLVNPSFPAKTAAEFIAYAKAHPDHISMASGGNGATGHVAGELFMMMAGIKMVHVPYRGESLALTDLLGGQVQTMIATVGSSIAYVKAGSLRPLAVTTGTRFDVLPEVPTLADTLPGYDASSWNGLCTARATPAAIIEILNREVNAILTDPQIKARFVELGGPPIGGAAADFKAFIAEDTERWAKVIKFSGAKAN
jgi:tripartite-type tricarboxylate transporter receptor subunit TctC